MINVLLIDKDAVVIEIKKTRKIITVPRLTLEENIGRKLPDNTGRAENMILDYTGQWNGKKLYKGSNRMAI